MTSVGVTGPINGITVTDRYIIYPDGLHLIAAVRKIGIHLKVMESVAADLASEN